jgi:hypothetical protein
MKRAVYSQGQCRVNSGSNQVETQPVWLRSLRHTCPPAGEILEVVVCVERIRMHTNHGCYFESNPYRRNTKTHD